MPLKYMPSRQIDNRMVKRKINPESRKQLLLIFLLALFLVVGMIFAGWVRWKQTEIVFRINQAEDLKKNLVEEQKLLKMELQLLQAPERSQEVARDELGMVDVQPSSVTHIEVEQAESPAETSVEQGDKQ